MRCLIALIAAILWSSPAGAADFFAPSNRLTGVGVDRENLSDVVLARRAELMIDAQTYTILRHPQALSGAERIWSPKLQRLFNQAERQSGLPSNLIAAVAYLESWGLPTVQSYAGPKGIMQIAEGTARGMGLKVVRKTKYKVSRQRVTYKTKSGKTRTKIVTRKEPYTVLVRDDRVRPELAVPAAARYIARLEAKWGRDWAIFAYHCGEGCVTEVLDTARRSRGLGDNPSYPAAFFGAHPAHNRELYNLLRRHMERDFSPTYYFRIRKAERLLALYREDRQEFSRLADYYRNRVNPNLPTPNRLNVWLPESDCESSGNDDPLLTGAEFFGFSLRAAANHDSDPQMSSAILGTIAYVAFETRRLHDAMNRRGEHFAPLEVSAAVAPRESLSACPAQMFDIHVNGMPPGEREALEFVLTDITYGGYLGFLEDGPAYRVGPSPGSRDFFTRVYEDAAKASRH